ncbi:Zn-ribbon domain-containing OB-fold protein [Actinomycetospora lutea]|uniref:Zn-ribbon domain-containing OB-fold protein n=1 Tax=Actinomycetospora lutea TaxID=663604 RepID=UPI00236707FC|nr:Zn-ribbon domain-containing OB-fold protein [Actinomycetospora lutea]MDD7939685.1 Zn-ribbon domain-containing OB-fold protein [Actinomycetospora lutea]
MPCPASPPGDPQHVARPFREGLLSLDPPHLIGARCGACGVTTFPARDVCPSCRAEDAPAPTALSTEGRVHSFTVVRQAPAGTPVPYVLAWIDLPADDVRLMAQVVGPAPEDVVLGLPVTLELVPFGTGDDGVELLGHRFRATQEAPA